jgi:hypothetical protein
MAGLMPCATKLRLLLNYDATSGELTWRKSARRGYKPGDTAGFIHRKNRYRIVRLEGRGYYAHRLIWKIVNGAEPVGVIDHIDGDRANNAWANLRPATIAQNSQNRKVHKNNSTGVVGVHPEGSHFRAIIKKDGVVHDLGRFSSVADAERMIVPLRRKLHGEYARLG